MRVVLLGLIIALGPMLHLLMVSMNLGVYEELTPIDALIMLTATVYVMMLSGAFSTIPASTVDCRSSLFYGGRYA